MDLSTLPKQLKAVNLIPLKADSKDAAVKWKEFQDHPYPREELPDGEHNLGVVCGHTSGHLIVVDMASPVLYQKFFDDAATLTVRTPQGGTHLYFYDTSEPSRIRKYRGYPLNVLAYGDYAVVPPSKFNEGEYAVLYDAPILTTKVTDFLDRCLPHVERPKDIKAFRRNLPGLTKFLKDQGIISAKDTPDYWLAMCPFHDDREPSFVVLPDHWHCFGCLRTGDEISFVEERERLSFREAVEWLASRYAVSSPFPPEASRRLFTDSGTAVDEEFVQYVMDTYDFFCRQDTEELLFYQEGKYCLGAEVRIKELIERAHREAGKPAKSHFIKETIRAVQRRNYQIPIALNPRGYLNVRNGVINLDHKAIEPHSPAKWFTYCLPVEWNNNADCPRFMQFLHEVAHEADLPLIQEIFGYCFWPNSSLQRAFMFVGSGSNGKSTLLNVLRNMLGRDVTSAHTLQDLSENRFTAANLEGKMANICTELPTKRIAYSGLFKALTGEDMVSAERKFIQQSVHFENTAKLIFSTNQLPHVNDMTAAFWRRWIVITLPNSFPVNHELFPSLLAELPGILNYALVGYYRLKEQKAFSNAETMNDVMEQWKQSSDSVYAFVAQCLESKPNAFVTKEDMYNAYCDFCDDRDLDKESKNGFGRKLPEQNIRLTSGTRLVGTQRKNSWENIVLRGELPPQPEPPRAIQELAPF